MSKLIRVQKKNKNIQQHQHHKANQKNKINKTLTEKQKQFVMNKMNDEKFV